EHCWSAATPSQKFGVVVPFVPILHLSAQPPAEIRSTQAHWLQLGAVPPVPPWPPVPPVPPTPPVPPVPPVPPPPPEPVVSLLHADSASSAAITIPAEKNFIVM